MVIVTAHNHTHYMDGYLKTNLDSMKEVIKDDWDFLILVTGLERAGKSAKAQQVGNYLSHYPLELRHVCMDADELIKEIWDARPGQAIIYDEAEDMDGDEWMRKINKILRRSFKVIGQKNLFIIIVMPVFFDLHKYYAIHRSTFLIRVYTQRLNGKPYQRGFFEVYSRDRKRLLYIKGKKFLDYKAVLCSFKGRFGYVNKESKDPYIVDRKEYKKKKDVAGQKIHNKADKEEEKNRVRAAKLMQELLKNGYTGKKVGDVIGVAESTVRYAVAQLHSSNLQESGETP